MTAITSTGFAQLHHADAAEHPHVLHGLQIGSGRERRRQLTGDLANPPQPIAVKQRQ